MNSRPILRGGKPLLAWSLVAALLFCGAAGQTTVTRQNYRLHFFGLNAEYATASATNPTAVNCQAVFKRNITNPNDSEDSEESAKTVNVSFDLLANPSNTTTVAVGGGITISDAQGAAWLRKRSEQAANLP
jgi:hypothetical protein